MTTVLASSALCRPGAPSAGWIAIDGTTIVETGDGAVPRGATDLGDVVLAPGFVDLQCNGVVDVDFATADATGWRRARMALARHGVVGFCPTFVSAPLDTYDEMLSAAHAARSPAGHAGADVIGVHLEGPFLGGAPGAHDPAQLRPVDLDWVERILERWPDVLQIVTLAPEADPGLAGTRALADAGVVVAIGHSTASYDEARQAADAGASMVTHLFNGMSPFHHRAPGVVGAALTDDRLTPTVIADLVHVHPAGLRIAVACKSGIVTVSDSVAVVDGLVERNGAAWLTDGRLAGATTLLDEALRNLVATGIPLAHAVEAVTSAPARVVGATDRGVLQPGARGDVVALEPRSLAVVAVWIGGVPVASR